jgi:hypothetical protein
MDEILLWAFRLVLYVVGIFLVASPVWLSEDGLTLGELLVMVFLFILYALAFVWFEWFGMGERDMNDENWFTYAYYFLGVLAVVLFFVLILGLSWFNDVMVFSEGRVSSHAEMPIFTE